MVWVITVIGVILLLALNYFVFYVENVKTENKESENKKIGKSKSENQKSDKKNSGILHYFKSIDFLKAVIELLVIILGATVAINFTELQEKRQTQKQMVALLDLARKQIESQYTLNDVWLKQYDESEAELGELKYNATYDVGIVEQILENDDALVTLTPITISWLWSALDNSSEMFDRISELDKTDENIYINLCALNSQLDIMKDGIEAEIAYLEGRYSRSELEKQYERIFNEKFSSPTQVE